ALGTAGSRWALRTGCCGSRWGSRTCGICGRTWSRRLAEVRARRRFGAPALIACVLLSSGGCGDRPGSRVLVVTTTDVTGKTSPCGCHTPKGGLARRATFLDSVRAVRRNVVVLDAGGLFPVTDDEQEAAPYMPHAMA